VKKSFISVVVPKPLRKTLRRGHRKLFGFTFKEVGLEEQRRLLEIALQHMELEELVPILNARGLNVSNMSDFYSPLPVVSTLQKNLPRWFRPSEMKGVRYDLDAMKRLLVRLVSSYGEDYQRLPSYQEVRKLGYGPGFTVVDAMLVYFMIREIKPRSYVEIGSGMSTWYSARATSDNAKTGNPAKMTCIDPYPFEALHSIPSIEVMRKEVQDVPVSFFEQLDSGDVLFIDSTHVIKIDGDVPYLYLEVLPRLKKGVIIHIHDIHFPFNVPYSPQCYIFGGWKWPVFWTEAMLLQALLCNSDAFEIKMSAPLLRHFSEQSLKDTLPNYTPSDPANMDTHFGSIWIEKTGGV
jgi:predicted O-methyltransferase YrrM